jgi:hypothetical protein
MNDYIDKCQCYIHSLKDKANDRHVLGEATIIKRIGDNLYLAATKERSVPLSIITSPDTTTWTMCTEYGKRRLSE